MYNKMDILNELSNLNKDDLITIVKYLFTLGFIIYFILTLKQSSEDSRSLTSQYENYLFPLVVGLIILIPSVFLGKDAINNTYYISLIIGTIVALFGTVFYFYSSTNSTAFSLANYVLSGIVTLTILVGLAIVFYFYSNYLKTKEGWGGFFIHLIFYVPCLILDVYNYIRRELELTTNVVYYLFLTEVVLIFLYNYLPTIISKIALKQGVPLLEGSAFLDIEKPIASSYDLKLNKQGDEINSQVVYRNNYSLSMWIMLNIHSDNKLSYAKETPIFNYGNGVPKITYVKKEEHNVKDVIKVYFTNNGDNNSYTVEIDPQKWNQLVFNYDSNSVDLFLNGNLEKTFTFDDNRPLYSADDMIIIGSNDGLDGAISNIQYYTSNQTRSQITNSYNLLMKKNPPTNNL
tara:strand:- start:17191 stop:18399 length:1209 start_codon:yes stop_codon:yes gene_type:complete